MAFRRTSMAFPKGGGETTKNVAANAPDISGGIFFLALCFFRQGLATSPYFEKTNAAISMSSTTKPTASELDRSTHVMREALVRLKQMHKQVEQMDRLSCYTDLDGRWTFPAWANTVVLKTQATATMTNNATEAEWAEMVIQEMTNQTN
jgi:hypothetical protein